MTFGSSPDPRSSIFLALLSMLRKLPGLVFGDLHWQAPAWISWTSQRVRNAVRYLMATPLRIVVAGLSLVLLGGGLLWYKGRPRPQYVTYEVTAPKLTTYDERGSASIAPLAVAFKEPVAPLASLDKPVASGIEISPKFAGAMFSCNPSAAANQ